MSSDRDHPVPSGESRPDDDPSSPGLSGIVLQTLQQARRLIVLVIGLTVVLFGVALLVLPGPAMVVIPIGLAILATEFAWARRLLRRVKDNASGLAAALRDSLRGRDRDRA